MMIEPEIEAAPWAQQQQHDEQPYREQIRYLYGHSAFFAAKLKAAGFATPDSAGGLADITRLPLTEKDELRATRSDERPIGTHLAAPLEQIVRIFSTSGTTGIPTYIPLTAGDLDNWIRISSRSYMGSGIRPGQRLITTYNAGPFVAGAALEAFHRIGLCQIPLGTGNSERLLTAVRMLKPDAIALTPSYALHLAEVAAARSLDLAASSVNHVMVAGEPGGGEPAMRQQLEQAWGAQVTEAMGMGDISVSLWGECEQQAGMHFGGRGLVHFELVDPASGEPIPVTDGARGELVLTHLRQRGAPMLRFRTRDHVIVWTEPCPCGRTAPRMRCLGRTDDMLIVRGVNLFPSALREVVNQFAPQVSGVLSIRPASRGVKQAPPLKVVVELSEGTTPAGGLAAAIEQAIRATLVVATRVELVASGTLPRSEYKSKLVDYSEAQN